MSPLHHIGHWLRELAIGIPLPAVRGLFLLLPIVLVVWVLTLPRRHTTAPDRPYRASENLKLWAVLALLLQVVVYSVL